MVDTDQLHRWIGRFHDDPDIATHARAAGWRLDADCRWDADGLLVDGRRDPHTQP